MDGTERRKYIIKTLHRSKNPVSASKFAEKLGVSRQVIVNDVALLRANGQNIASANRGYILHGDDKNISRVFKVWHTKGQTEDELTTIVDLGGTVEDVFVYHKVYGIITAPLKIKSRLDVKKYLDAFKDGKSSLLSDITSGFHYHTVSADSTEILDLIQAELKAKGYLAKLMDYEPIDFWH